MPCNPNDVSFDLPDGPTGPPIIPFGSPFSLDLPNINPFPEGFPENLLDLLDQLQMLIPPGILKPQLNPNFGKDVFDAIMKLMDQFLPFLMLYKFFLPILRLLLCIIEVLCSMNNPFKLVRAMKRLFRNCIPDFLNLFPLFALIMMIISLLLLLLALIEYIINQIIKFIKALLRNILNLQKAIEKKDDNSIMAIAKKLGSLLCIFQNFFVLFAIFNIIIQAFRDMLNLIFSIPPCDDTEPSNEDGCCTPDVCPSIVKTELQRYTANLKYLPKVQGTVSSVFNIDIRTESWQIYDTSQPTTEQFRNVFDAYDVTITPKPVFFPMDSVYNASTPAKQAAYTMDLRFYYEPFNWGRQGDPRFIQFKDCIVSACPSENLSLYDNTTSTITTGVIKLAGGLGYEDDGTTVLTGFDTNGTTAITAQATLENFLHNAASFSLDGSFPNDGYVYNNVEYIFKPNLPILLSKNLVTSGCMPDLNVDKTFVNTNFVGPANFTTAAVNDLLKPSGGGGSFPNPGATQEELATALSALRSNLTTAGVAQFETAALASLAKLKEDTENAIGGLIGLGFDPCKSSFTLEPTLQFVSRPITIKVDLNERNGTSLTLNLPTRIANNIATRIKAHVDDVEVSKFEYDGYQQFTALLSSKDPIIGPVSISFDDQILCTNTIPENIDEAATHTLQVLNYQFVYTPVGASIFTAESDSSGQPRRTERDISRNGGGKDGV